MKFIPYDRKQLGRIYRYGCNQKLITDFIESDLDCVRIDGYHHKSAKICQANLITAAKSLSVQNTVRVVIRNGEVFLLRKIDE